MTNEELQKLKELTKNAQEGARNGWPFYPEALAKAMTPDVARKLIELAERATQPVQEQQAEEQKAINDMLIYGTGFTVGGKHVPIENVMMFSNPEVTPAPSQDRCCDHDSDCSVHNAPAYPVGPCDCTLSGKPAQDQVAAVRAVPDDDLFQEFSLDTIVRSLRHDDDDRMALWEKELKEYIRVECNRAVAAAPSPQPELSGSIDGPEFREKLQAHLLQYQRTMGLQGDKRAEFIAHIDAWKDAACAAAVENAQAESATWKRYAEGVEKRATDAEAKLAEVREASAYLASDAKDHTGRIDSVLAKNSELEAKLAAIQSQAAGDAQDAARYRWLKSKARIDERDGGYHKAYCLPHIEKESGTIGKRLYHVDFDSAVDAAMREQQP